MTVHGWTVADAAGEFEHTGLLIAERNLRGVVRNLPEFRRIGEGKSGERGGRGAALYDIGEFQLLHKGIARWLTARDPAGHYLNSQ